jgi:hypothetical protein
VGGIARDAAWIRFVGAIDASAASVVARQDQRFADTDRDQRVSPIRTRRTPAPGPCPIPVAVACALV